MKLTTYSIQQIKHQQGIVLVVALLILIVMTILGVSMLSSSTLEERMASNIQAKSITFQAAESCVRISLLPPARVLRNNAAKNKAAAGALVNPNVAQNCAFNGVNASVAFTIPIVTDDQEVALGGSDLGDNAQVQGTVLFMTGTSTLASGTSSSVTFAGKIPTPK